MHERAKGENEIKRENKKVSVCVKTGAENPTFALWVHDSVAPS